MGINYGNKTRNIEMDSGISKHLRINPIYLIIIFLMYLQYFRAKRPITVTSSFSEHAPKGLLKSTYSKGFILDTTTLTTAMAVGLLVTRFIFDGRRTGSNELLHIETDFCSTRQTLH